MLVGWAPEALLVGPEPAEGRPVLGAWSRVPVALGLRVGIPRPAIVPAGLLVPAQAHMGRDEHGHRASVLGAGPLALRVQGILGVVVVHDSGPWTGGYHWD